jgi:hypothetical protein
MTNPTATLLAAIVGQTVHIGFNVRLQITGVQDTIVTFDSEDAVFRTYAGAEDAIADIASFIIHMVNPNLTAELALDPANFSENPASVPAELARLLSAHLNDKLQAA